MSEPSAVRELPLLSKTDFVAAAQCEKRLYLEEHRPELAEEPGAFEQSLLEEGVEVGLLAQERYPNGRLIQHDPDDPDSVHRATREAMDDDRVEALYEAAFGSVRVDVLRKLEDGGYEIVEVKSASEVESHHVLDAAYQYHVLSEAGVDVRRVTLLRPNKEYRADDEGLDLEAFFLEHDVTESARQLRANIAGERLPSYEETLERDEAPDIDVGSQCRNPVRCPFYDHCHRHIDALDHPIDELPYLRGRRREAVIDTFGLNVLDIPDDRDERVRQALEAGWGEVLTISSGPMNLLTANQERVRQVIASGEPYIDEEGIREALEDVRFPAHFVDFETVNPAVPVWSDTRPYQVIPFQWSNHVMMEGGRSYHEEFVSMEKTDPRPRFLTTLLDTLGYNYDEDDPASWEDTPHVRGSIFVYSSFERKRLEDLAEQFPAYAPMIADVKSRLVDLYPIVRNHVYHPEFHGSFSIKKVLPALVDGFDYEDLEIQDGATAAAMFMELVNPDTPIARRWEISRSLQQYCERDTEAMIRLLFAVAPWLEERITEQDGYGFEPAARRRRRGRRRGRRGNGR